MRFLSTRSAPFLLSGPPGRARGCNYAMIVMGVSARPGEELFFGNTALAVLREGDSAVLYVAS